MPRMHTTSTSGYASNATAFADLDGFLDQLRRLERIDHDAAKECAEALRAKIRANVAAQLDPWDHGWRPSQSGEPVLKGYADAVSINVQGTTISFAVNGVEAMHQVGSARGYRGGSARLGGFRRPVIPFSDIPGPWRAVLRTTLSHRFNVIMSEAA